MIGAATHMAQISMEILRRMFLARIISCVVDITWCALSPAHAVPDFFLWVCIKSKVYKTHPANIYDLRSKFGCVIKCPLKKCYKL